MRPDDADPGALHDEEAVAIERAVDKRRRHYAAGRILARRLLGELGTDPGFALVRGDDGAPQWPAGIVGTISHTSRLAAVAVARRSDVRGLGLDVESDAPVSPEVEHMVCTPAERGLPPALVKVVFAAKEAVYKAQYPLTGARLGFADVRVELDVEEGRFVATLLVAAGSFAVGAALPGRFATADGLVATSVTLT